MSPWVRLQENALTHPKIVGLVDLKRPFDLWVWGLSYCQTHLTDGVIPSAAVPCKKAATTLVGLRLWETAENGYAVHDYLDWNEDRQTVNRKREDARLRAKRSRTSSSERSPHVSSIVPSSVEERSVPSVVFLEGVQGKPRGNGSAPLALGLKRFKVWRWMLDDLIGRLGSHADTFSMDRWLAELDNRPGIVPQDSWKWLQFEFYAEVEKRGLPIAKVAMTDDEKMTELAKRGPSKRP